jgi:transglutaminase-like putative cysteine protease
MVRPSLPYLHGLLLLGLVAALVWGERLPRRGAATAVVVVAAAGGVALAAAPALDPHQPWVDYRSFAGAFSAANVETFDWSQHYGPLIWPRTGREVIDIQARRPDYWKAENLDTFNGTAWVQGPVRPGNRLPVPDPSIAARWTQTLRVTLRGIQTTDMISAGFATQPRRAPQAPLLGASPGTWTAGVNLGPGDSYLVDTYSPRPSPTELAASRGPYPNEALVGYRTINLPPPLRRPYAKPEVVLPPFHSAATVEIVSGQVGGAGARLIESSPYAGAYALSQRLARAASTPLAYVQLVERYLASGFTYSENPPRRPYPLESFLFQDKVGYCQQFSGAMALLLRMGGIPARVSAGFTSGDYDPTTHQWLVTDLDAHSWVEAWFPRYGWVRFDPTPSAAPALAGKNAAAVVAAAGKGSRAIARAKRKLELTASTPSSTPRSAHGSTLPLGILIVLVLGASGIGAYALARGRPRDVDGLVAELERALARSGRPLSPGTTLAQLERRFRASPQAAAYVRALLLARYGGGSKPPTPAARRALRARLADGLGVAGRVRALWALPPRLMNRR